MMYIIAVYLNSLVIVAFLALIMHSLKFLTLLTWMMKKTIYPVRISILTATITMISAFLFNRIVIIIMKTPSISPFNDTLSLMHLNIRSIPSNLTKLVQYLSNLNVNFDIIGISETWLNETNKYIYNLNGYNHVPLVRQDRVHGGVALFISASFSYRILNEISIVNKDIECIFIEIELNGDRIHLLDYIPHSRCRCQKLLGLFS